MSHFINPSNVNPFDANMTGPDRRSGAMMSKVGNPQIYEDHEQRYVSLLPNTGPSRLTALVVVAPPNRQITTCPRNMSLINGTSISASCASLFSCDGWHARELTQLHDLLVTVGTSGRSGRGWQRHISVPWVPPTDGGP